MKKAMFCVMLFCAPFLIASESSVPCGFSSEIECESNGESARDSRLESNTVSHLESSGESQDSRESTAKSQDSHESQSIFLPAQISTNTFASFVVGYGAAFKSSDSRAKSSIYFSLDRGWLFVNNALLFSLSLDGAAGEFYALALGAKLGWRALNGRIIPSLDLKYGLLNHKISGTQHNLHGTRLQAALFIDIARGLGAEIAYFTSLYRHPTIKKTSEKVGFHGFMINFKFIDFGI